MNEKEQLIQILNTRIDSLQQEFDTLAGLSEEEKEGNIFDVAVEAMGSLDEQIEMLRQGRDFAANDRVAEANATIKAYLAVHVAYEQWLKGLGQVESVPVGEEVHGG